jgi:anti-sigma B factor antagonist
MQLRMSTRTLDGVIVVDCSGRIVFGEESATLRDAIKKVLTQSPRVVLNLAEVSYIDSGGLGTLVSLYTTARNAGGALKLARLTQRVGDLLQLTKLVSIFEVFENEQLAAQSFKKDAA